MAEAIKKVHEKICNVYPRSMIYLSDCRPFDFEKKNILLRGREIETCMMYGQVEEVLNDGTTAPLSLKNYLDMNEKTIIDTDEYLKNLENSGEGDEEVTPPVVDPTPENNQTPDIPEEDVVG